MKCTPLEIVVFDVGGQRYGLPLSDVREVLPAVTVAPLPRTPAWAEGVINLRGNIVPVLDIRPLLGLPGKPAEHTDQLIVARVDDHPMALRTDHTVGLVHLNTNEIESSTDLLANSPFAHGVAKLPDGPVFILNLRGFISERERAMQCEPRATALAGGNER